MHWNFFSTVAVVGLLGALVLVPPPTLLPLAAAVTAAHQSVLTLGEN